jgi:hypothetical protein
VLAQASASPGRARAAFLRQRLASLGVRSVSSEVVVPRTLCDLLGILRERRRAQVLRMLGELRRSRELRGNVSDATYQESVLRFPVITRRSSWRPPRTCCLVVDQAIRTRSAALLGCNCEAQRTGREVPHSRPHRGR